MKLIKKIFDFFTKHPARFFILAALLWFSLMCYLNSKDVGENGFSWHDLLVEANGMVFDLLVFGVLLSIYEALRAKRERIERYKEEIDDFKGWDEKEASYRTAGLIRRLNREKATDLKLQRCYLAGANLSHADLFNADLSGANFWYADLSHADLRKADFSNAYLFHTNLPYAKLQNATLIRANLTNAEFFNANLSEANLEGAFFEIPKDNNDWFDKLENWQVIGREEIMKTYVIEDHLGVNSYLLKVK